MTPFRFVPVSTCLRGAAAVVVACALVALGAAQAHAAVRHVPAQYPTFQAAYNAAKGGDTIEVAPGHHPPQNVPRGTKAVTFHGAPGAKVRALDNSASNVTFDGIEVDAGFAQTAGFENHGADNVTFKNAAIGNVTDEKGALISGANFTFDNVLFHDAVYKQPGTHMECVYAIVVPGFTVRNSVFRDCAIMDLFFTYGDWWSPLPPAYGNVTIENNVFQHPEREANGGWHFYGLLVGNTGSKTLDGWVVRNNTFENDASVVYDRAVNSRWVGNVGAWDCVPGMVYSHNVGDKCGPTDRAVSPASSAAGRTARFGWRDPLAGDFTLAPGSPAINAGDPKDAPALDRNGFQRDARPDAGAHEFGAGPAQGGGRSTPRAAVLSARLKRKTICKRVRRGCGGTAKLRLAVTTKASVTVRVLRLRKGGKPRLRRKVTVPVRGARTVRLRARRLLVGRYRVVALLKGRSGNVTGKQAFTLHVRR